MSLNYEDFQQSAFRVLLSIYDNPEHQNQSDWSGLLGGVAKELKGQESTDVFNELEKELFSQVYWDLFRQGILYADFRPGGPQQFYFFNISDIAPEIIRNNTDYYFRNWQTYERLIQEHLPNINKITKRYLKESVQSYSNGCYLAASVLLGVTIENAILNLREPISESTYKESFKKVWKESHIKNKIRKLASNLEKITDDLPDSMSDSLDTTFSGIQDLIRRYRNESGHPSGSFIGKEQCFVLLQLFIPYYKAVIELSKFFESKKSTN